MNVAWEQTTRFKGPEQSPGFLLWRVSTLWRRQVEAALATLELTHPQFVLLASLGWLARHGKSVTQVELARHCGTDITMTSQVLRALERKGLIERKRCEGNERSKFPCLTPSGVKLIEKAIPLVESVDADFFKKLGRNQAKYTELLQVLAEKKEKIDFLF
jgi:DNA-binding MarR family transcriptional regulator